MRMKGIHLLALILDWERTTIFIHFPYFVLIGKLDIRLDIGYFPNKLLCQKVISLANSEISEPINIRKMFYENFHMIQLMFDVYQETELQIIKSLFVSDCWLYRHVCRVMLPLKWANLIQVIYLYTKFAVIFLVSFKISFKSVKIFKISLCKN